MDTHTHDRPRARAEHATPADAQSEHQGKRHNPYARLALMALLSFLTMFVLMYAMVDQVANALPNINQAYMAALMAAPMVLIELALMGHMYQSKKRNAVAIGASLLVLAFSFFAIRQQVAVGDAQFVRSMIPHHAGAVLMCEQAPVTDAEIQALCQSIIANQRDEITQMKTILRRIES